MTRECHHAQCSTLNKTTAATFQLSKWSMFKFNVWLIIDLYYGKVTITSKS